MALHHRRLPHLYPAEASLFLTWHLHGSVPTSLRMPGGPLTSGQAFVWLDRQLDTVTCGPRYLRQPEIARVVVGSIHKGVDLGHYKLGAWVVMANHVHLLIEPAVAPERLMRSLKGTTAREANRLLGRTGEPFWQKESYDHWVRNGDEFCKIKRDIENKSGKGRPRARSAGLSLVERGRRDESRRGTQECMRHVNLALVGFGPAADLPLQYFFHQIAQLFHRIRIALNIRGEFSLAINDHGNAVNVSGCPRPATPPRQTYCKHARRRQEARSGNATPSSRHSRCAHSWSSRLACRERGRT